MMPRHFLFLLMGCSLLMVAPSHATDASALRQKLNGGYYLLYHLAGNEDQVPILLDLKTAPPSIGAFADRVSKEAKETLALIEKFRDQDPAIDYDKNPLPPIEQDVRASITDDKQHQLLFGSKDAEFVRRFCISQIEASTYAMHLAKVLAGQETNPSRAAQLRRLSEKWHALREDAQRILRDY